MTDADKKSGHAQNSLKYIFVTGGVLSGLGKGIVSSSIGTLLQARGYKVAPLKIDGYLNVDAGTMNPIEHGEVFVLDDGTECDMDLGNYERFLNVSLTNLNSVTTGKVMKRVLDRERKGEYLGKTVQMIPHVTGEIKNGIKQCAMQMNADVAVIEIGGTVGDLESSLFLEAARELAREQRGHVCFIHVTLVPVMGVVGEQKTKPTQHSVRELMGLGIQPDVIVARASERLTEGVKKKLAMFCNTDDVISDPDMPSIYHAPIFFEEEGLMKSIEKYLSLESKTPDLKQWKAFVENIEKKEKEITIAITGKYTQLKDSYTSIFEALNHCSAHNKVKINVTYVETTDLTYDAARDLLKHVDGVIVPGGYGIRGTEGKINCIRVCRENNIPYLGLCFGMQLATIEFSRNVCGIDGATSTEFDENAKEPVIHILEEQKKIMGLGSTQRLGSFEAHLAKDSLVSKLYGGQIAHERHRHRWEVNPSYAATLEKHGLHISGKSKDGTLAEFIELPNHPFFVGTQAHPELKSRPLLPHPLFMGFTKACIAKKAPKAAMKASAL